MAEIDGRVSEINDVLKSFLLKLRNHIDVHKFEKILSGDDTLSSSDIGQKPEAFTEDNLIYPLLEVVGLDKIRQPYGKARMWPDFEITNLDTYTIGENKSLNKYQEAEKEIKEYLDRKSIDAEYGIATDGICWTVFKIETGGDTLEYPIAGDIDLRDALIQIAKDEGLFNPAHEIEVEEILKNFLELFSRDTFNEILSKKAPKWFRDERKKDIDDFYDLYIELLFGKGKEYEYESCLRDDIKAPRYATENDIDLFAITLVNRLLFIKFLEDRKILEKGFLKKRVEFYETHKEELTGCLYTSQIKPLFYDLLNTPMEEREPKHRRGWFKDVPYLNGGLFKENIDHEKEFQVSDRLLPQVIDDLIEGHELELKDKQIDPAILGSVFEKTINHIEQERTQKDIGAYYTPNDVTKLIIDQTVDEKVRDIIIETFAENIPDDEKKDAFLMTAEENSLEKLLRNIENQEGWYANPDALKDCIDRLTDVKILDPACGSGHFLTAAMDEIFRSLLSLKRGLTGSENGFENKEKYDLKKILALNCIYGVDVDRVAAEIAKLRVWLKIVEGNGWEPDFGKLPNIEVNIEAGNTLIGFPYKGGTQPFDAWGANVEELMELREKYKFEDGVNRYEIMELQEELREKMDSEFLSRLNYKYICELENVEELQNILETIGPDERLKDWFGTVKVVKEGGAPLEDDFVDDLDDFGFKTYKKSARLDISEKDKELRGKGKSNRKTREIIIGKLIDILNDDYIFEEFEHRPTTYDLENILGDPFHWVIEFPEVSKLEDTTHKMNFDMVLGNPPYGDLLNKYEKTFLFNYVTNNLSDISAQFIERGIQLLDDKGYFGNITILKITYDHRFSKLHYYLKENISHLEIACFERRPCQVFKNAQVQVGILTGQKNTNKCGTINTSNFIRFNEEDRNEKFKNIAYTNTDGFVMKDKIGYGVEKEEYQLLPKIGGEMNKKILLCLKQNSDRILTDVVDPEGDYIIYRQRGGGYKPLTLIDDIYKSSGLRPIRFNSMYVFSLSRKEYEKYLKPGTIETKLIESFEDEGYNVEANAEISKEDNEWVISENGNEKYRIKIGDENLNIYNPYLHRDLSFLLVNSSFFYFYWMTYSNARNLDTGLIKRFPFPNDNILKNHSEEIQEKKNLLWDAMKSVFDSKNNYFIMSSIRDIINEVDDLVGELFNMSEQEIEFIKDYDSKYVWTKDDTNKKLDV